jgi:hypothetical protein
MYYKSFNSSLPAAILVGHAFSLPTAFRGGVPGVANLVAFHIHATPQRLPLRGQAQKLCDQFSCEIPPL